MKATAALAGALALGGCAGLLGPSPKDVQAGLDGYRAREAEMVKRSPAWPVMTPELTDARLDRIGDCGPLGAYFLCDGTFVLADGSAREVDLWLIRVEDQWRLQNIVPKALQLPTQADIDREVSRIMVEPVHFEGRPETMKLKPFRFTVSSPCHIEPGLERAPRVKCFGEITLEDGRQMSGVMELMYVGGIWRKTAFGGLPVDD